MPICQAAATSPYLHSKSQFLMHCHMLASRPPSSSLLLSGFWTSGVTLSLHPSVCLYSVWLLVFTSFFLFLFFFLTASLTPLMGGFNRTANCLCHQALAVQLDSPLTKITLPFFFFFFSSHLYPAPTTSKRRKKKKKAQCGGPRWQCDTDDFVLNNMFVCQLLSW